MKVLIFILSVVFLFAVPVFAQTPTPAPVENPEDDVVKITTSLVQMDAIVTDKDGNQVTDLKAEDFEITQDSKPQKITAFSYVDKRYGPSQSMKPAAKKDKNAIPTPPVINKSSEPGRILTFIVDDGNCNIAALDIISIKQGLENFVNQMMQPNDLIAIYQTRGGTSLAQQYTSDKTRLLGIIKKIRWLPPSGPCIFLSADPFDSTGGRERGDDFNRNSQILGSIGVMRYVIRGLEKVQGRKVVFLMSSGLPVFSSNGSLAQAYDALREITDLATRASITFNTFGTNGGGSAIIRDASESKLSTQRTADLVNSYDGLGYLADETGGKYYRGMNFLEKPLQKALNLEKGYYLIGYEPEDETFKGRKYHKLKIVLKRPDLKISYRTGFYGLTDEELKPKKKTGDSELYEALVTPLPDNSLNLQLTAFYGNNREEGDFVRSLIYIDGEEITFVDDPAGYKKAVFDVVAVTLDEKNRVVDEFNRTHTFKVEAAALPFIKKNGLIYSTDVPVKKSGNYNFRVAMRDASSKTLGSASQVLQIPDLKKKDLFLSELTVSQADAAGKFQTTSAVKPENALAMTASHAVPAIRQFKRGMILAYSYAVYNAQLDKASSQPKLEVRINLYRDGNLILEGPPQPMPLKAQTDWTTINDFGYFKIEQNIQADDYVLQVIVKDLSNKETVSQWINFEVTN